MSTLREAIEQANKYLAEQITAESVRSLDKITKNIVQGIALEYGDFFYYLSEEVTGSKAAPEADTDKFPRIFQNGNVTSQPWHRVSGSEGSAGDSGAGKWWGRKEKAYAVTGDTKYLHFYTGVSSALGKMRGKRKKREGSKRRGVTKPFNTYLEELASKGPEEVTKIFGGIQVSFTVTRPDGGTVHLQQLPDAVKIFRQWDGKGKFAKAVDGTTLHVSILAFPKLIYKLDEYALTDFMRKQTKTQTQWYKVTGSVGRPRPILLPLLQWYMNYKLPQVVKQASEGI